MGPTSENKLLSELFEAARISAFGAEDILESMVKDMELGKTRALPPEEDRSPFLEVVPKLRVRFLV